MHLKSLIIILSIVFGQTLWSQSTHISSDVEPLSITDFEILPELNNNKLKSYYHSKKETKNRFAEARDVSINPRKDGIWESTKNGNLVWRYGIKSPGAQSINLGFDRFELKNSVSLFIYGPNKKEIIGPFTHLDNDTHEQLWTPIIIGDEIIIELQLNKEDRDQFELNLARVNHDFVGFHTKNFSQSCNLDVICGAADGWEEVDDYRDIIRSVGAYTIMGVDACSGALINNTEEDCTPFFLTANHCEINSITDASVTVYWNFENQTCRQPLSSESGGIGNGLRNQFNTGSTLRATATRTDFLLIELDDPVNEEYNPFYAGWSRSEDVPSMGVCIHHPGLEEKRISFDFDSLIFDNFGLEVTHIVVEDWEDWDIGSTESGSSGSPLFNQSKQIVGQLEGGQASCSNNEFDVYGWFGRSWEGAGTLQSSLKFWLDPNDKDPLFLDGRDCRAFINLSESVFDLCKNTDETLPIEIAPFGFNDKDPLFLDGRDCRAFLILSNHQALDLGQYHITLVTEDDNRRIESQITLNIYDDNIIAPILLSPNNGVEMQNLSLDFEFTANNFSSNVIQLATDESFDNIAFEIETEDSRTNITGLSSGTLYFWRVKSVNACKDSDWSQVYSFQTSSGFCTRIYANEVSIPISLEANIEVQKTISFPYAVEVQDVNVEKLMGEHSWVEDLSVTLNFNDIKVGLFEGECSELDDFDLGFDDSSERLEIDCPPTTGYIYRPLQNLSQFNGLLAGGDWTIIIKDLAEFDGGSFDKMEMEICFSSPQLPVIIPRDHKPNFCEGMAYTIPVYIYAAGVDYELRIINENNEQVNFDQSIFNPNNPNIIDLSISDISQIAEGKILRLELLNKATSEVLAISAVETQGVGPGPAEPTITSLANGATVFANNFENVRWEGEFSNSVILEIAEDPEMMNVVYRQERAIDEGVIRGINFDQDGIFYLRIIQNFDCGMLSSAVVMFELVSTTTSINEAELLSLEIYPNPVNNELVIRSELAFSNYDIKLFDLQGRNLSIIPIVSSPNTISIDLSHLDQSMYVLTGMLDEKKFQKKIIKL